jgi:hypothetical protein
VATTTAPGSISILLTRAHRDAILQEIEFVFESAGGLTFMLERGAENRRDRDDARALVSQLQVAVDLLDQLGWDQDADREGYPLEVDEAVDRFAERIETAALAGLKYNRPRLFASDEQVRETTRRLIDSDLEKLRAGRRVRTAFRVARELGAALDQESRVS